MRILFPPCCNGPALEWALQLYVLSRRQRKFAVMLIINRGGTSSDGLPFFVPLPIFFPANAA